VTGRQNKIGISKTSIAKLLQ